jgi:hypothetical protein
LEDYQGVLLDFNEVEVLQRNTMVVVQQLWNNKWIMKEHCST